jgi:hypothetical protein
MSLSSLATISTITRSLSKRVLQLTFVHRKSHTMSQAPHYWLAKLRETSPDPQVASLPPLPPDDSVRMSSSTSPMPATVTTATYAGASSYWLGRLVEAENRARGGDLSHRKTHAMSQAPHFWLAKLRETSPDPQVASLPPLPPNDAVRMSSSTSPPVTVSTAASAAASSYWLGRLVEAENRARGTHVTIAEGSTPNDEFISNVA